MTREEALVEMLKECAAGYRTLAQVSKKEAKIFCLKSAERIESVLDEVKK